MFGINKLKEQMADCLDKISKLTSRVDNAVAELKALQEARKSDLAHDAVEKQVLRDGLADVITCYARQGTAYEAIQARLGILEAREADAVVQATIERDKAICRLYATGKYYQREVAEIFGVSRNQVRTALKREGDDSDSDNTGSTSN